MQGSQGGGESDPAEGVLTLLHQRLAASTWWYGPRPSIREVGRNGETTTLRGPTIWSPPNRLKVIFSIFESSCHLLLPV